MDGRDHHVRGLPDQRPCPGFALEWLFFVGLVVVALGAVVGKVMQMMGMGNTVAYKDARDPEYDENTADSPRS